MRKIIKIARLELSILFYSPIAWLVLAIFMIQCGISFLENLQGLRTTISLGYPTQPITSSLFSAQGGLFRTMQGNIYLYIPILTMGLMSRETSSGSIKLLLSSPVKLRQIILGKFFAIITYGLSLVLVLMIFAIIGAIFIDHVDLGLICSGLLALYLLICTYASIGLFMSCLTTYQVVAAISTLAIFAIMRYVGTIGQDIDFVRDLTYFLSISGRTEKMIAGLITTKDIAYFLIIIASFLSLCVLRLKSERELKPWTVKAGRYVLLICVALSLGYLTSRPTLTGYLDTTAQKSLTITKSSQEIAKKIDGPLKVTTYVNMLAPHLWYVLPQSRNYDLSRIENFQRFIPGMDLKYEYYYSNPVDSNYSDYKNNPNMAGITDLDKIAEKMTTIMDIRDGLFMKPSEMKKKIDLAPEGNLLVRKLEYKDKSTFLRFYMNDNDPYAGEAEVDAALKRMFIRSPKVIFISGNNERSTIGRADRSYEQISALKTRRKSLVNQGFDVDTVNLNTQEIPADADILVLADPTIPYSAASLQKIATYINKGGNMLIAGEPGRQDLLNPVLQQLGVQLKQGLLIKIDKDLTPGFVGASVSPKAVTVDSSLAILQKKGVQVTMQTAAAIELTQPGPFKVEPLLLSMEGGWNKQFSDVVKEEMLKKDTSAEKPNDMPRAYSGGGMAVAVGPVVDNSPPASTKLGSVDLATEDLSFNSAKGDENGVFPIAATLTRTINGKEQRIVVSGDADFISNGELARQRSIGNEYYLHGLFRWFSNGSFPIDVTRPPAKDMDIKISRSQITGLMWLCKGIIPALIAIIGGITLFKRRRN